MRKTTPAAGLGPAHRRAELGLQVAPVPEPGQLVGHRLATRLGHLEHLAEAERGAHERDRDRRAHEPVQPRGAVQVADARRTSSPMATWAAGCQRLQPTSAAEG